MLLTLWGHKSVYTRLRFGAKTPPKKNDSRRGLEVRAVPSDVMETERQWMSESGFGLADETRSQDGSVTPRPQSALSHFICYLQITGSPVTHESHVTEWHISLRSHKHTRIILLDLL